MNKLIANNSFRSFYILWEIVKTGKSLPGKTIKNLWEILISKSSDHDLSQIRTLFEMFASISVNFPEDIKKDIVNMLNSNNPECIHLLPIFALLGKSGQISAEEVNELLFSLLDKNPNEEIKTKIANAFGDLGQAILLNEKMTEVILEFLMMKGQVQIYTYQSLERIATTGKVLPTKIVELLASQSVTPQIEEAVSNEDNQEAFGTNGYSQIKATPPKPNEMATRVLVTILKVQNQLPENIRAQIFNSNDPELLKELIRTGSVPDLQIERLFTAIMEGEVKLISILQEIIKKDHTQEKKLYAEKAYSK